MTAFLKNLREVKVEATEHSCFLELSTAFPADEPWHRKSLFVRDCYQRLYDEVKEHRMALGETAWCRQ